MTTFSEAQVTRVAQALRDAPPAAYMTPLVYPWAVQNFTVRPCAARPTPPAAPHRLYVHVPFCNYRCTFCCYAVRTGARRQEMDRYIAAVMREMEWIPAETPLSRLTVGGGTPTALPPELLETLLRGILSHMSPTGDSVHTIEASPDSLSDAHIRVLRECGIARVSVGVESMTDTVLDSVKRRHSAAEALDACRRIVDNGLMLNLDLMYGLPAQTQDDFRRGLDALAGVGTASICLYGLRLNKRTAVRSQLTDAERLDLAPTLRWRSFVKRTAEERGYVQVRPYAFKVAGSRPGWYERPPDICANGTTSDLALGMSARCQMAHAVYQNHPRIDVYLQRVEQGASPVETMFDLDSDDLKTQFLARLLANGRPMVRSAYGNAFGTSIDSDFGPLLDCLRAGELIADDGDRINLTELGMLVYDRVLLCFYPRRARDLLSKSGGES